MVWCVLCLMSLWTHQAQAATPRVVASIQPLQSLAAMLLKGIAEPGLLLEANQSPHSFSLTPSQMRRLKGAELLIWVGPELERPLARVLAKDSGLKTLRLMGAKGIHLLPNQGHQHDEAANEHKHGHEHGHEHQGQNDPHLWLSPANGQQILELMAEALAELDPAQAPLYRERAIKAKAELARLDEALRAQLAPVQAKGYMVYHDAYRYFEQHYGLSSLGAITLNPEQPLGAATLERLRERIRHQGAICLFVEPQFSPRLGERLAESTGIRLGQLDPIGADIRPGPGAYPELLRRLADALVRCLQ
jgi:zinc transport system substrate-binding protein